MAKTMLFWLTAGVPHGRRFDTKDSSRLAKIVLAIAFEVLPKTASAQDTRNAEQLDANHRLNTTYQSIKRQLSQQDQAALMNAERAWTTFRDADCAFGIGDHMDCLIQRTDERREQFLKSTYYDKAGNIIKVSP